MMEWNPSTIRITMARRLLSARLVADMRVQSPPRRIVSRFNPRRRLAGGPSASTEFRRSAEDFGA